MTGAETNSSGRQRLVWQLSVVVGLAFALAVGTVACSSSDEGGGPTDAGTTVDGGLPGTDGGTSVDGGDGGSSSDGGTPPPPATCSAPISLADTSTPDTVIGTGTPDSCTEAALATAVSSGGIITFNCGAAPATIQITSTLDLPIDTDTIIDGGGTVTLDAGKLTRHFYFEHPDWMNNPSKVVLQRLKLVNGKAPTGTYYPQDPGNPDCAYGYKEGSGGAIFIRNGVLHVIDCEFLDNEAAAEGPDVGGGAIYALGVPEIIVVGSRFVGNTGANAGAIGMLFANPGIYNSVFENNHAIGVGMNYVEPGCPNFNHDEQGGAGGNGGAIAFDGMNDDGIVFTICGAIFRNNRANELGGAIFRTPNVQQRQMLIEQSLFDGNTARMGGVSFIKQNDVTLRTTTVMNNRSGLLVDGTDVGGPFGGFWFNDATLDADNCTFHDNEPNGLVVEGGGSTVRNATFVSSQVRGVSVHNSLFADTDCSETLDGDHNLQWPNATACAGGTTFADPEISAIGDHGGPTPTFLPAAGGAVEGLGADCPATDQRGEPRTSSSCAAGAVEP